MSPKQNEKSINLKSDKDGIARGAYNAAQCKPLSVSVEKQGYESYFSGFRPRYVMKRRFSAQEVSRLASLDEASRVGELKELLAGDPDNEKQFRESVFYYEARLRPDLRALAHDELVTERARYLLALIAAPEDLQFIMDLVPPPSASVFPERWRYAVATALVNPDDEREWSFLRKCALNEFNDRWTDAGAIQSLKLNGSVRSRNILEEAQQKNQMQASRIASALAYLETGPDPFLDTDVQRLAQRVAEVLNLGTWDKNGAPYFNESGDKALIDLRFRTFMDLLIYTATFQRVDRTWRLRGVHETLQAFAPPLTVIRRAKPHK